MKFCYIDESGTGDEPYAVMVGIVVDAKRMHLTKTHWSQLLETLSDIAGKEVAEIHTRDFYAGNGPWRGLDGNLRARIIDLIFGWLAERKHHLVFSAVDKAKFYSEFKDEAQQQDVKTLWRFLGLHVALSLQKYHQKEDNCKGHTVLIVDNEEKEKVRFCDLLRNPPSWTDSYYGRRKKQDRLDQIVDVPYFGDSEDVALLQLADLVAYFVRRHIEIQEKAVAPKYKGEDMKVAGWFEQARDRCIPVSNMYMKKGRCDCADLFHKYAPSCIQTM